MKNKVVALTIILALVMSCAACLVGCDFQEEIPEDEPVATSYVSIDINPSIRLVLDQNQKVTSYCGENDDALVLLYGEGIIGLDIQEASQTIVKLATKMGYLREDNCEVQVLVSADDLQVQEEVLDKIELVVENVDKQTSFKINCDEEGSFLLNYQLSKLKENNPDNEYYQNLTVGKLRLINSAMAIELWLPMDKAVTMTTAQLLEIVDWHYNRLESYATTTYEQAKVLAQQTYELTVVTAQETVYLAKYLEYKGFIEGGLATVEYGGLMAVAKSLELIAKGVELLQGVTNKILANEDVLDIAITLGVDVEVLKDEDGNVTVDSVSAYVDKVAKKNADKLTQEMREGLSSAVEKLEKSKDRLQDKPLSQEVVSQIQTLLAKINIKDIEFIYFTLDDLKTLATEIGKKAGEIREKMDHSLTAEQKDAILEAQLSAVDKLDSARNKLNQAIDKAAQDAKISLQNLKKARLERFS